MVEITHIPVVFDKSHLLTIGKRLYATSLDLIRELVSNAYDADATLVRIEIGDAHIVVADNGSGMDENGLRQYFTIGSQEKRTHAVSSFFHRKRIGEFGIGKFSTLTVADRFVIETQSHKKRFRARLTFDAHEWSSDAGNWHVPCEILPYDPARPGGTTVILEKIKKPLEHGYVIRHIRERLPLGKDDFRIFVNGSEVAAATIPGKRFPVSFTTPFGAVEGEIILANIALTQRTAANAGITIRVKQIAVTKSLFGFEASHTLGINRLRGSVNADFLPITSSRDSIMQDSEEYRVFYEKMQSEVRKVLREVRSLAAEKENIQASRVLRDALDNIGRAFKKNPVAMADMGEPPVGFASAGGAGAQEGYVISKAQFVNEAGGMPGVLGDAENPQVPDNKKPLRRRHAVLANRAIIRKMRFQNLGIVCRMERFGPNYPPSFLEQGIILLNIDHPLYLKQADSPVLLRMFVSTLIAKELALKKHPYDADAAFTFQHQLLTDAFRDVRQLG